MRKKLSLSLIVILFLLVTFTVEASFLENYVSQESDVFQWQQLNEQEAENVEIKFIEFTSQTWQGMNWKHRLRLIIPKTETEINMALLFITGSGSGEEEIEIIQNIVKNTGVVGAVLHDVPNQPLFGGKTEDEIIAYTFAKYMETKDESWPLLVPMTKTAVKAMDVVQEYFKSNQKIAIEDFTVSGASKRGWTTWLVSAVDERVKALAPMVYDNLDLISQMEHQIEAWGKYSQQIHDYTDRNFPQMVTQGDGKDLVEIVDPYSYLAQIPQPKLIIIGTNDPYWPLDALNIYYNDLIGKNYIRYVPNAGHGLGNARESLLNSISGFILAVDGKLPFPGISWEKVDTEKGFKLEVETKSEASRIKFWGNTNPDTDFRDSKWYQLKSMENTKKAVFTYNKLGNNYMAGYAEIIFEYQGKEFSFCSNVYIK